MTASLFRLYRAVAVGSFREMEGTADAPLPGWFTAVPDRYDL